MDTSRALSYSADSEDDLAPSYNTHSENVSGVLASYSSAPSSIDYTAGKSEAPMLTYSSSPPAAAGDGQGVVNTAEPRLFNTSSAPSSIDYTPENVSEAPTLTYSSSPSSVAGDGQGVGNTAEPLLFTSSAPVSIDYTPENVGEAPMLSYIAVAQSVSDITEALFYSSVPSSYVEADSVDVSVPLYTATPSDHTDTDKRESQFYTLATYASTTVSSFILTKSLANTESSGTSLSQHRALAHYDGSFDPVERDAIEMSAWTKDTAEIFTTDTGPRYGLNDLPKYIVERSIDWYNYTLYDCSTQTYYFPYDEASLCIITPPRDLTDSSNSGNYADSSAPSYTSTPSYNGVILNPNSSSSAESASAGLLDPPSPKFTSTIDECRSRLPGVPEQQVLSLCTIVDANEDARYIIGRSFNQHFQASHSTDVDGNTLKYIKVVRWKFFDVKERWWYTWERPLLTTYFNDYTSLVSDEGLMTCGGATVATANDHPLASDGGFVVCCSVLFGDQTISEISITNPTVMTKMVLPMPTCWNDLFISGILVNLAVDSISQAYKIVLINRYQGPFLCVFDSTTNQWRISSNPTVRHEGLIVSCGCTTMATGAGNYAYSVIFQDQLFVLSKTSCEAMSSKFWLQRYNFLEDSWTDCGLDFDRGWPFDRQELVVSGNRLFVVSGFPLQLVIRNNSIRLFNPLQPVSEILLTDSTLVTDFHLAEPMFDAQGLEVDGLTCGFNDPEPMEEEAVRSFELNRAFGFGNSIMLTYRWLGFSIVYNLETRLCELLPKDPTVELYGNVMPLRPPRSSGEPITKEL